MAVKYRPFSSVRRSGSAPRNHTPFSFDTGLCGRGMGQSWDRTCGKTGGRPSRRRDSSYRAAVDGRKERAVASRPSGGSTRCTFTWYGFGSARSRNGITSPGARSVCVFPAMRLPVTPQRLLNFESAHVWLIRHPGQLLDHASKDAEPEVGIGVLSPGRYTSGTFSPRGSPQNRP